MISNFQRRNFVVESIFNLQIEGLTFEVKGKISITCKFILHFKMYLYFYFQNKIEKIKFETKENHELQFGLTFLQYV